MVNGVYSWNLGDFRCFCLYDGFHRYQLDEFFQGVPRARIRAALRRRDEPTQYIETPYTCLLIDTGERRVLIDMGAGSLTPNTGLLPLNLRQAGYAPDDIDTIIITHAHPDHIGGSLDEAGQPVYGRAQIFIGQDEWAFWMSDYAADQVPASFVNLAREKLMPLNAQAHCIREAGALLPGFSVIPAPGHTPGHLALAIHSADQRLLHIGDAVLHRLHLLRPDWHPIFDIDAALAAQTKAALLSEAAETGVLVFAHHLAPFPNLGHVSREGTHWRWHPINGSPPY